MADFGAMWRSVQVTDPDPMIPHRAELDRLQEEEREKGAVELWLDSLDPSSHRLWRDNAERGIRAEELYGLFKDFEDENIRSSVKTPLPVWGREMKRLIDLHPRDAKFTRKRAGSGMRFFPTERLLGSSDNIVALHRAR